MTDGVLRFTTDFRPRPYQKPLFRFMRNGGKRAVNVWHRRAGKDLNWMQITREMAFKRVGMYWHMLPTIANAKKAIWDGIDNDGNRFLDVWQGWRNPKAPGGIVKKIRHDELRVELINGSMWQVLGFDNFDSLMGPNPVGVVMSEYAIGDPRAWEYLRPILRANGGWAGFPYTPRGRNHGHKLLKMAQGNDKWFAEVKTVDDTGVLTEADIQEERDAGMPEEMIQQEFYCSFDASLVGSYFGKQITAAEHEGRICPLPFLPDRPVYTAWDIGRHDATAIWFYQRDGAWLNFIHYFQAEGQGAPFYAAKLKELAQDRGFQYTRHDFPHDVRVTEWGTDLSRIESLQKLGVRPVQVPKLDKMDQINAARQILARSRFDAVHCEQGVNCLKSYQKTEYEAGAGPDGERFYRDKPLHNWASHGADAYMTGAVGFWEGEPNAAGKPIDAIPTFDEAMAAHDLSVAARGGVTRRI